MAAKTSAWQFGIAQKIPGVITLVLAVCYMQLTFILIKQVFLSRDNYQHAIDNNKDH